LGDLLIEGLREAIDHVKGKRTGARETTVMVSVPDRIDVAAIRARLGLSRPKFSVRTRKNTSPFCGDPTFATCLRETISMGMPIGRSGSGWR
jgi:hypothetical protein